MSPVQFFAWTPSSDSTDGQYLWGMHTLFLRKLILVFPKDVFHFGSYAVS